MERGAMSSEVNELKEQVIDLQSQLSFQEDAIKGLVKMQMMEDGPNKPVRLEIEVPGQAIKIVSETYDWIEQK